ncbi:four helix bundle protein [Dactylococcopsis salina]|uniref:S23 ribosomal protein n=1 Tax=Dactylococcopsis salina (strain PCC 8305) TaxID=13035 RepID=K9YXA2_DACS8|nr:four helix bundle protein [Dactylococcopsis salina]AFZ51561.1 S23 ribosomal protein [Dactylococcopsis salina PCC 8305]
MSEIKDFKDLIIWQKGMEIAEQCYFVTKKFPKEELYGMVLQVRKSSSSIPANISEGYGRRASGDYKRFLNIAQGSVNETETHLLLSARVGLCTLKDMEIIINNLKEETRMISALIKKLNY